MSKRKRDIISNDEDFNWFLGRLFIIMAFVILIMFITASLAKPKL